MTEKFRNWVESFVLPWSQLPIVSLGSDFFRLMVGVLSYKHVTVHWSHPQGTVDLSLMPSDLFIKDRVHLQMLHCALLFGTEWNLVPMDKAKRKRVFKSLPSQMKWFLIETTDEFLSTYMEKGKDNVDFIQNSGKECTFCCNAGGVLHFM